MEGLSTSEDRFGGITVSLDADVLGRAEAPGFGVRLSACLEGWAQQGKRGVWLRVQRSLAHLIDPAVMLGFDFHHAAPGYVMLTKWLPSTPSSLPAHAHHQVGVGGLVLDGGGRVLCVRERAGPSAGLEDFWKLPGGLVDAGEDLGDAAVREVLEETGVRTAFECVATVRESHSGRFGCTDLYAICVLRLDGSYGGEAPEPAPQESEIAAAEWRDLGAFLESRYYQKGLYGSLLKTAADVALRRRRGEEDLGVKRTRMRAGRKEESVYYVGGELLTKARL